MDPIPRIGTNFSYGDGAPTSIVDPAGTGTCPPPDEGPIDYPTSPVPTAWDEATPEELTSPAPAPQQLWTRRIEGVYTIIEVDGGEGAATWCNRARPPRRLCARALRSPPAPGRRSYPPPGRWRGYGTAWLSPFATIILIPGASAGQAGTHVGHARARPRRPWGGGAPAPTARSTCLAPTPASSGTRARGSGRYDLRTSAANATPGARSTG